jgi:hypothetical protein
LASLQRLLKLLEEHNVAYMLIDGYALPFYGRIRTTVDIDLAVAVRREKELIELRDWLEQCDFEVTIGSFQKPLIVVVDRKEGVELKMWTKPDGVAFDDETLKRRRKVRLSEKIEAWVISPEDFIVNKLARLDRDAMDEQDVKSVLVRQGVKLDEAYVGRRARQAGVATILQALQTK